MKTILKKYVLGVAIAMTALVSVASAQTSNLYQFSTDLTLGSTGQDVVVLQNTLNTRGFTIPLIASGAVPAGYFGAQTQSALAAYQTSVGLPANGFFGQMTREYLNRGFPPNLPPSVVCPIGYTCTPISGTPPTNTSGLTLASPNGGEVWQLGSSRSITWSTADTGTVPGVSVYLTRNISGCFNLPPGQACLMILDPEYTLASNVANTGSLQWTVGSQVGTTVGTPMPGSYFVRICPGTDRTLTACDTSDAVFTISATSTSGNNAPTISGIDGPTALSVGQEGSWVLRGNDVEGSSLRYSVRWGDESTVGTSPLSSEFNQTASITHTYRTRGTYSPLFTVQDDSGQTAQASISVNVTGGVLLQVCPEKQVIDRRVLTGTGQPDSYYVINGARRELNEVDTSWTAVNCGLRIETLY